MQNQLEAKILELLKETDAANAQAALVTVLYTLCKMHGFPKDIALQVISEQWDRLEKTIGPKLEEILK